MPRTDFPMRGNLGQNEPMIQKRWEDSRLYDKVLAKNEDRPLYRFMTVRHTPTVRSMPEPPQ